MSGTEVIAGATVVRPGEVAPAPLLEVPGLVEVAVFGGAGGGPALLVHNPGVEALAATVEDAHDVFVAPLDSATVPLPGTAQGARLHLVIVCAVPPLAVTAVVSIETSAEGAVAVGQAIGVPLP